MKEKQPKPKMGRPPREGGLDPMWTIRVPIEDREQWRAAAQLAGKSLSDWARDILNRAAKRAARK